MILSVPWTKVLQVILCCFCNVSYANKTRLEAVVAVNTRIVVLDVKSCTLVRKSQRFGGT